MNLGRGRHGRNGYRRGEWAGSAFLNSVQSQHPGTAGELPVKLGEEMRRTACAVSSRVKGEHGCQFRLQAARVRVAGGAGIRGDAYRFERLRGDGVRAFAQAGNKPQQGAVTG